ncbi:hypothetical protein [Nocardioides psychrotolerans]|uniref:hypothetical protein n=1 Tax=Nocardioides psychrotolerans TaxID=1005945 RepID=UPI000B894074|nr:hypothetical protein [Nocardioides psychrotolerans]
MVPEDAAPPLAMTEVHPLAVCSYAAEGCTHGWRGVPFVVEPSAIAWVERERTIRLRWWQRLAMVRQLEHDVDGRLLWRVVVESGSRRIGKSERLRSLALWRMERGVELFEPEQVVVHVGRDVGVASEVQARAWSWCRLRGWDVKTGNGKESVTHTNGARWLVKSQNAGYGFDVHLGLADECWDIVPQKISGAIEPATLERESSQLVLTSTSNQAATSLMKNRISAALAADDGRTLLLLWGVEPGADLFDEATWRAASAHWTEDRRVMIGAKLREAQDAGPQVDDPDPVGSWANNYLNVWDLVVRTKERGDLVFDGDSWGLLEVEVPERAPDEAAIESWFGEGLSVALAWRLEGGPVVVRVLAYDDLPAAVAAVKAARFRGTTTVGATLLGDPALSKLRARPGQGRTSDAVKELARLMGEDAVRHDGQEHLRGQVLALRTVPGVDGRRVSSKGRADAVKAAVWAIGSARARKGRQRLVLPSS